MKLFYSLLISAVFIQGPAGGDIFAFDERDLTQERADMVKYQIEAREIKDSGILRVMNTIPRHRFVPENRIDYAYDDSPLPIGYGQTISQPYIVALMTDLLNIKKGDNVLEIGTGSGYQAAVLAELGAKVFTVEIIKSLADRAEKSLRELGYRNVAVYNADGFYGLPASAPFDGIIVTAAAESVPPPLIGQLKKGGVMVIPVGPPHGTQYLILIKKDKRGKVSARNVLPVRFVPLTRGVR